MDKEDITCQCTFQDPFSLDEELFDYFLRNIPPADLSAMRMNDAQRNRDGLRQRGGDLTVRWLSSGQELRIQKQHVIDNYRMFNYLVHFLQRPWLFIRSCPVPLPVDVRRRMVLRFYQLDPALCREIYGMSAKKLKEYRAHANQRFQVENVRAVLKHVTKAIEARETGLLPPDAVSPRAGSVLSVGRRFSGGEETDDGRSRRGSDARLDAHGLPRLSPGMAINSYIRVAFQLGPAALSSSSGSAHGSLSEEADVAEQYSVLCFGCKWGIDASKKKKGGLYWQWPQLFRVTRQIMQNWGAQLGLELDPRLCNGLKAVRSMLKDSAAVMDAFVDSIHAALKSSRPSGEPLPPKTLKAVRGVISSTVELANALSTKLSSVLCVVRDIVDSLSGVDGLQQNAAAVVMCAILEAPLPDRWKKGAKLPPDLRECWMRYVSVLEFAVRALSQGPQASTPQGLALSPTASPRTAGTFPRFDT